jgi:hypothetical protein
MTTTRDRVLRHLQTMGAHEATAAELARETGKDVTTVRKALKELVGEGLARETGSTPLAWQAEPAGLADVPTEAVSQPLAPAGPRKLKPDARADAVAEAVRAAGPGGLDRHGIAEALRAAGVDPADVAPSSSGSTTLWKAAVKHGLRRQGKRWTA